MNTHTLISHQKFIVKKFYIIVILCKPYHCFSTVLCYVDELFLVSLFLSWQKYILKRELIWINSKEQQLATNFNTISVLLAMQQKVRHIMQMPHVYNSCYKSNQRLIVAPRQCCTTVTMSCSVTWQIFPLIGK